MNLITYYLRNIDNTGIIVIEDKSWKTSVYKINFKLGVWI